MSQLWRFIALCIETDAHIYQMRSMTQQLRKLLLFDANKHEINFILFLN